MYVDNKPDLLELYHHGIKGQEWGVKNGPPYPLDRETKRKAYGDKSNGYKHKIKRNKYQDKHGVMSEEAKKRYNELYSLQRVASKSEEYQTQLAKNKKSKGIVSVNNTLDIVKKGSVVKRIANADEPIDDRVKYISILDNDSDNYIDTARNGGLTLTKDTVQKEYSLKKDMKVAPANVVRDYIMQEYGDVELAEYRDYFKKLTDEKAARQMVRRYGGIKLKDIYDSEKGDTVSNLLSYNQYNIPNIRKTKLDKFLHERAFTGQTIARKMFRDNLYTNGNKVYDHFKKMGYDAIVDIEDLNEELFDYPLIVLNPRDTMAFKKNNDVI